MTRDEAIDFLERMKWQADYVEMGDEKGDKTIDMAIEALKQPEIIRCEGCHYYDGERCDMHKMMTDPADYCSYAVGKYNI